MSIKYCMILAFIVSNGALYAAPFVTTILNKSDANIVLEFYFSDKTSFKKNISIAQSYDIVNLPKKLLRAVKISSLDRDKNGNLYQSLRQSFKASKAHVQYAVTLQDVPAYVVPAYGKKASFVMPDSKKFICSPVKQPVKK